MRQQSGYLFRKGNSWFLRYSDSVRGEDGSIKRQQLCRKLPVAYGGAYKTKASVKPFVTDFLAPLNTGTANPQSTMSVTSFTEEVYFPLAEQSLRTCTVRGYRQIWNRNVRDRIGKTTLRDYRTMHGERLLADCAKDGLGRNTLKHTKAFLSGIFKQAKRLGYLDTPNPIMDVSIPRVAESEETHAVSLEELEKMLLVLPEPAKTLVLTAALSGLRKSELRGLRWSDYNGAQLSVQRSMWRSEVNETKTARSKAPVPVIKRLADALNALRERQGLLAHPDNPIFQGTTGKPIHFDYMAREIIRPALQGTGVDWHGWHSFRRGLATMLHGFGVPDREIQGILRHSNISVTQACYVKSLSESQIDAMQVLETKMQSGLTCNKDATSQAGFLN
ncbi:MAG TPA: site-specific integrase [Candidatus Acidoferrales bacterium]|nr:site-specific integrase [Candidatus Acidoferrales bacterium]